jgi:tetratricopeptide (TPR) repeat protein
MPIATIFLEPSRRLPALISASLVTLSLAIAGCASSQQADRHEATGARHYDGFGGYKRTVTTRSPAAQRWFDQGLQLLYGFNHDEAIRSFRAAAAEDPACGMAWWGIAYASGLHINNPEMTEAQSRQGHEASQEALRQIDQASPPERALIVAVSKRYAWPAPADRSPLDRAYADAMEQAWLLHPNDPDIGALFAESLMNLQPWDYWTKTGEPKGRTPQLVAAIERVLELRPDHPGANHFYIHAMEASNDPHKALAAADRLGTLVPGSGHLVHMPAHIYARIGRYADASDINERAIAVDRAYLKLAPPPAFYSLYYVHNIHFLAWSAMMEGRHATAMQAARDLESGIPESFLRDMPQVADGFMPVTYHVMIRFGRWNDILAEPEPPAFRHVSRTMRHYARGVALSALGRTDEARSEMDAFESEAALIPEDWKVGNNKAADVVAVARRMLTGELAYREGRHEEAFAALAEGAALEDALVYDEPPGWMQPVRHAHGALLMGVGRAAEAERTYRDDLARNPGNGWAMLGLEQALLAQGNTHEVDALAARRSIAWARADVTPTSSCYCRP